MAMNKETESKSVIGESQDTSSKPTRTGLHRYFHTSRLDWYLSAIIAMVFVVFGVIELFDIAKLSFIRMGNSFQFALLFGIFGMVARIYYKLFEGKYDK
mgnify:CR=1 FL=1